jgi:hypothetical protein
MEYANSYTRVKSKINLEFIEGVGIEPCTSNPGNQHPKLIIPGLFVSFGTFQTEIL